MNELRPTTLDNFISQENTIKCLRILVNAAISQNNPLPHILFDGGPGLGKTTLANILAEEMGVEIQIANGGCARSVKAMLPYLMKIEENSIFFIDEIHRLTNITSELLYPVMEDYRVDIGKEEAVSIDLPKFTLIGATTESGHLPAPLRDRFQHKLHLSVYTPENLVKLIKINAGKTYLKISSDACINIANRARGTPRVANNLLSWIKDYGISKRIQYIDNNVIDDAMNLIGVDKDGLDRNDHLYLHTLRKFHGKPAGILTLVSMTGLSRNTLEQTIEPFLLRQGKIAKTNKGRILL